VVRADVVAEQLRATGAVPEPELKPVALAGDEASADQLTKAAYQGDGAAVSQLLAEVGADPNTSVGWVALCAAAQKGRLEAAGLLLDAGADPSLADGDGYTPLMWAAQKGHLEVLWLLLARGAAVDAVRAANGWTAFHYACLFNHADCAETLVRAGYDVGIKSINGQTGQEVAVAGAPKRQSNEVVQRLRQLARQPFVGVLVELAGLVGAAEHNGKRATVWPRCRTIS
jgi:ankyrin repeat protein